MSNAASRVPVIIGTGQTVVRELASSPEDLPTPISLAADACRKAIHDTGISNLAPKIDSLVFVRLISDSIEVRPSKIGRCNNPPRAVAQEIGADPGTAIYSVMGGQAPQALINEISNKIAAGDTDIALLTGAEAIAAMRHANRHGMKLNWNLELEGQLEDRGIGAPVMGPYETANGMGFPPQVYGAFENAWRYERGFNKQQHRQRMAELFTPFSRVAASNPYAQFPIERDVDFLATPSYENYDIADPYLKWHVAQDAVNQGAAVILTSVAIARKLGVAQEKWVYPLAGADVEDKLVYKRESLSQSQAMKVVLEQTLLNGHTSRDAIQHLDLYSCFPCAVQFACDAMDLDPFSRQLTQTGGLPFFGGAGNNYSMHAIASMVDTLRSDPGATGLILANGGFMSKNSAGLYSTAAMKNWQPVDSSAARARIDSTAEIATADARSAGRIESYSVVYQKNVPFIGYAFCRTEDGARFMARTATNDEKTLRILIEDDPIGETVKARITEKRNLLELN